MKIAYLLETTDLCGGVKVVFRQAEALIRRGVEATVISSDSYPAWFDGHIPFIQADPFAINNLKRYDHIIATTYRLVTAISQDRHLRTRLLHLVQGYEGDLAELQPALERIQRAYALHVPKLTISEYLAQRLKTFFPDNSVCSIGQGLETTFFYPPKKPDNPGSYKVDRIVLMGPLTIGVKQIQIGLEAFHRAAKEIPDLKLVRLSSIDTREAEESLVGPIDTYHIHLPPRHVGTVLRSGNGILLSPSMSGEGFGLPPIEAMACGVPTILTDIPSFCSYATPCDYALFVPWYDSDAMAGAICYLAGNESLQKHFIQRGLEIAAQFTFDKVAANIEKVLLNKPYR